MVVLDERGKTRLASAVHVRDNRKLNRLMAIKDGVQELLDGHQIHSAAIEEPYIGAHPQVGAALFVVEGVLLSLLNEQGISEIWAVYVPELKAFVSKPRAQKSHVGVAVYKRWAFDHPSADVTDAYVLAHIARAVAMGPKSGGYRKRELAIASEVAKNGFHIPRTKT